MTQQDIEKSKYIEKVLTSAEKIILTVKTPTTTETIGEFKTVEEAQDKVNELVNEYLGYEKGEHCGTVYCGYGDRHGTRRGAHFLKRDGKDFFGESEWLHAKFVEMISGDFREWTMMPVFRDGGEENA